MTADGKQRE